MKLTKSESIILVFKGFVVFFATYVIGGYYLCPWLANIFPKIPQLTIRMISVTDLPPLIAIAYLLIRTKSIPTLFFRKATITCVLAGVVAAWGVALIGVLLMEEKNPYIQEIFAMPFLYYYLGLFSFAIWGPVVEETFFRGYLFEILRESWGNGNALLISSVLFVLPHYIWEPVNISFLFIFLWSIIFTITYMKGGLIASILVHILINVYFLYLNIKN